MKLELSIATDVALVVLPPQLMSAAARNRRGR
jgi:hypothetical protein